MNSPINSNLDRLQQVRRSIVIDMSSEAIDQRLRQYFQLWTFWTKLRRFQKVQTEPLTTSPEEFDSVAETTAE